MIAIATIYAKAIIRGDRTFASVPKKIKREVKEVLISMGREDLVVE